MLQLILYLKYLSYIVFHLNPHACLFFQDSCVYCTENKDQVGPNP